jgi:3-deoxy-D-manno-octulosonic-acid transferase
MTPTGRETGGELLAARPERLTQAYLPYDLPDACGRFLDHFQPRIGLLMETELWPNLIAAARRRQLPLALINGRLSARSLGGYMRLRTLIRPALASLSAVAAQTTADAERLQQLGARQPTVCGNLKFDVTPAADKLQLGADWRHAMGPRPVCLLASSREGEEALLLDALATVAVADLLLVLVPRHPQRFAEVAALLASRGLSFCRRSSAELPGSETQVWLGDSMGEMARLLCAGGPGCDGRELVAVWRPEPDRGGGLWLSAAPWSAHFQFRPGQCGCDRLWCWPARA